MSFKRKLIFIPIKHSANRNKLLNSIYSAFLKKTIAMLVGLIEKIVPNFSTSNHLIYILHCGTKRWKNEAKYKFLFSSHFLLNFERIMCRLSKVEQAHVHERPGKNESNVQSNGRGGTGRRLGRKIALRNSGRK